MHRHEIANELSDSTLVLRKLQKMPGRAVLVEPASSGRSSCHQCTQPIAKDELRVQEVDDTEFKEYIRQHGRAAIVGEGYSRGYFETEHGVISIKKHWVHLTCYKPKHPKTSEWFKKQKFKKGHKELFEAWLNLQTDAEPEDNNNNNNSDAEVEEEEESKPKKKATKRKSKNSDDDNDDDYKSSKSKKKTKK